MFTRPDDLSDDALREALLDGWEFSATSLEYVAVGFGTHHWVATDARGDRRFVNVDDVVANDFDRLHAALRTAQALRDAGLDFVAAPFGDVQRIDERWAISVYPYLVGRSFSWGEYQPGEHRTGVLDLLARLHAATDVARLHALREDFALPERSHLERGLRDLGEPWDGGPYSERARELLTEHATEIERVLATYDGLVAGVDRNRMVITHGEPHPANTMEVNGRWVLIDWDTALIAPPERDLWMISDAGGDPDGRELYRLQWRLAEIGIYTSLFRQPHTETEDTLLAWKGLVGYVTGSS